jgi:hypothetical protein
MGGACSSDGEGRGRYRVLVGKPEGKSPVRRSRRRWEDNIKTKVGQLKLFRQFFPEVTGRYFYGYFMRVALNTKKDNVCRK